MAQEMNEWIKWLISAHTFFNLRSDSTQPKDGKKPYLLSLPMEFSEEPREYMEEILINLLD